MASSAPANRSTLPRCWATTSSSNSTPATSTARRSKRCGEQPDAGDNGIRSEIENATPHRFPGAVRDRPRANPRALPRRDRPGGSPAREPDPPRWAQPRVASEDPAAGRRIQTRRSTHPYPSRSSGLTRVEAAPVDGTVEMGEVRVGHACRAQRERRRGTGGKRFGKLPRSTRRLRVGTSRRQHRR